METELEFDVQDMAQRFAEPYTHEHHHIVTMRDRDRFEDDLEEMREAIVDQEAKIGALRSEIATLVGMLNFVLNVGMRNQEAVPHSS